MTNQLPNLLFMLLTALFLSPITAKKKDQASLLREIKQQDLRDSIPRGDDDNPLNVKFGMYLINVAEADPSKKEVEINAWLILNWNSGIRWDIDKFRGLESIVVSTSYIWTPDISVFNGLNKLSNTAPDFVLVSHDGEVVWVPRVSVRTLCDVDPYKMGWNISCNYRFGFWANMDEVLNITRYDENLVYLQRYFEESRFEILGASATRGTTVYPCCPGGAYSYYDIVISFKEKNPPHSMRGCCQSTVACH